MAHRGTAVADLGQDKAAFGRRDALALLAGLAALRPALAASPAAPLDRAGFLAASGVATGMDPAKLTGMADALQAAFAAHGPALQQLAALAAAPPADLAAALRGTPMEAAARALAAAWYTGTVGAGADARLLSYEDALAWRAAGYEAVPGTCAGEFGFWSEPPAAP